MIATRLHREWIKCAALGNSSLKVRWSSLTINHVNHCINRYLYLLSILHIRPVKAPNIGLFMATRLILTDRTSQCFSNSLTWSLIILCVTSLRTPPWWSESTAAMHSSLHFSCKIVILWYCQHILNIHYNIIYQFKMWSNVSVPMMSHQLGGACLKVLQRRHACCSL